MRVDTNVGVAMYVYADVDRDAGVYEDGYVANVDMYVHVGMNISMYVAVVVDMNMNMDVDDDAGMIVDVHM